MTAWLSMHGAHYKLLINSDLSNMRGKKVFPPAHRAYLGCARHGAGEGNGTPLQYSCLEYPMDGGAWWAAAHGVAKSQT